LSAVSSRAAKAARDLTNEVKDFFVYMVSNRSGVVLYAGVTNNLERRIWEHRNHVAKGFPSKYKVNRLVYYEQFPDALSAIMREKEIKGWNREKKNALVHTMNPTLDDFGRKLFGDLR
jgi:putative endonuclease